MNEEMIMNNKVKKFMTLLSGIIIALAMIFFGSGNAWAADVSNQTEFEAALSGADTVITLTDDITLNKGITVSRAVYLTASKSPITLNTAGYSLVVALGGNLTVDGNLTITGSGGQTIRVQNAGIFTLSSGDVISTNGSSDPSAIHVDNGGTVNINGGTVKSASASTWHSAIYIDGGGTVNINGGTIVSDDDRT